VKSTMGDDLPLTVTSILRHGATWHGDREVVTAEDEPGGGRQSASRVSYEEIAAGAAQLAHALRSLGIHGDDRVGTYLWNNREHLEAYLAVPAMGAVLHTANIRLFTDELVRSASPPAPPASRRASPTATGRSTCTRCRCAPRTRSRSAPPTAG
jgi:fatty-acyl-CoA synthase